MYNGDFYTRWRPPQGHHPWSGTRWELNPGRRIRITLIAVRPRTHFSNGGKQCWMFCIEKPISIHSYWTFKFYSKYLLYNFIIFNLLSVIRVNIFDWKFYLSNAPGPLGRHLKLSVFFLLDQIIFFLNQGGMRKFCIKRLAETLTKRLTSDSG